MQTHDLIQGSPEWHAHRATTYNASDAPAMLGCSPYETRSQFIARLATGIVPEVDAATQRRFDDGHRFERLARPLAEAIVGEELYAVTGSQDFGLDKPLSASLDGSTITDETLFEHKSLNDDLRAVLPDGGTPGDASVGKRLPKVYRVQMEQQLMVTGAGRVLFMASRWNSDDLPLEMRCCWYESDAALRAEILAGWKQASEDAKAYTPPAPSAVEKIVAEPVEALPAPTVKVTGQIALVDNFKAFEVRLREFLDEKLIREPKTDEDFVNLDSQIKAMKAAREALKAAEIQMLAQVEPIDVAKKSKDMLDKLLQQNVKLAEELLTAEKERRKGEIVAVGTKGLADHIAALNKRLGMPYMPAIPADFGGCIKGLKSLASMEDKVATELARAKIAANEVADRLQVNLTWLRENAADFAALFPDTQQIIQKAPDDFKALAENRINAHKVEQARKEEEARAEIRRQEEARAQAALRAEEDRIRREAEERARADLLAEQQAQAAHVDRNGPDSLGSTFPGSPGFAGLVPAPSPAPAPQAQFTAVARPVTVNPVPPAANDDARVKLGDIVVRIAPLSITADGLAELGFKPVSTQGNAKLYREADYQLMVDALIQRLLQAKSLQVA